MTYYLVYATEYLMTSEGTEIRTNRTFAAVEAGMNTLAEDGMPLNHLVFGVCAEARGFAERGCRAQRIECCRQRVDGAARFAARGGLHRSRIV